MIKVNKFQFACPKHTLAHSHNDFLQHVLQPSCDAKVSTMDVVQNTTHVVLVMVTVITMLNVNQVLFVETTIVLGEMVMTVV